MCLKKSLKTKKKLMIKLLSKVLLSALAFILTAELLVGVEISGIYIAIIVSIIWGLVNLLLKPILVILTLPINILTLGLFTLVINAFLFWFVSTFIDGFSVEGAWAAFLGALLVSVIIFLGNKVIEKIG